MTTPEEIFNQPNRRHEDLLTKHRLDKLEEIVKDLALTVREYMRVEIKNQQNSEALEELKKTVSKHGDHLEDVKMTCEKVKTHDKFLYGLFAFVAYSLGQEFIKLLGGS